MGRGIYGQNEGNETRMANDRRGAHFQENELCEGDVANHIRRLFLSGKYKDVDDYTSNLKTSGWSTTRIECILSRAMLGIKIH